MDLIINPYILYVGIVLGAIGVCLALPRARVSPQGIGALLAALAGGLVIIGLGLRNPEGLPNLYFYLFSILALGSALRVISHQRPVYAALYFILTILASAGMYLLLSAEFMAFALIIVYAGAILITYLFVIMLATQAPSEEETERLEAYDAQSRDPVLATIIGFVLLAALSTMLFRGSAALPAGTIDAGGNAVLAQLPRRVERSLRDADAWQDGDRFATDAAGLPAIDPEHRTATLVRRGEEVTVEFPESLQARNVESLAFNFLNEHPGTIEIAGVLLLMAMLGAVVLSRRQVQFDEEVKARQARRLAEAIRREGGAA
ncbi:MAG: NADH-quinone oxidoreductase subunit J [Phycisphaerales bacterium]